MIVTPDRRGRDRRANPSVAEPLDRKASRRAEDRRDASRPFKTLFVQSSLAPLPILHRASLSLGGAKWVTQDAPEEAEISLHLQLPDMPQAAVVAARIERRRVLKNGKTELYAAFLDLDLKTELALARFLESRGRLAAAVD
jgi:hypothetical protein